MITFSRRVHSHHFVIHSIAGGGLGEVRGFGVGPAQRGKKYPHRRPPDRDLYTKIATLLFKKIYFLFGGINILKEI